MTRGISVLSLLDKSLFVREILKYSFGELGILNCKNCLYLRHITNASVLQIHHMMRTHAEAKSYFSGELISSFYLIYIINLHDSLFKFTLVQGNMISIASSLKQAATKMGKYVIGASENLMLQQISSYFARIFVGTSIPQRNLKFHLQLWIIKKAARTIHVIVYACWTKDT